jgi:hypothetical protein
MASSHEHAKEEHVDVKPTCDDLQCDGDSGPSHGDYLTLVAFGLWRRFQMLVLT